ncbi:hypothetical protein [Streptomyces sp. NPDC088258]|uniref:hypothetical protein n=1 Tax=Streptomyces sp. NPDC088258 TaxID=3365849 RepID=UPI003824B05E
MTTLLLTLINLFIAGATLGLGTVKALAARHEREWTLALTASVLLCAGVIFLLATPVVYRSVGAAVRSPNISALLVPVLTLVCVAHAHTMSQLWQPHRRDPAALRSVARRWGPVYGGAIVAMAALYAHAELGPATPLRFAAAYAHVPEVVALHLIYWTTLITTSVVTIRECRSLSPPGRPALAGELRSALGWFAAALGFNLANVALAAVALIGSATGPRRLDTVAQSAWLATIASCVAANVALASMVLRSRRAERQDQRTLKPLLDLVSGDAEPAEGATSAKPSKPSGDGGGSTAPMTTVPPTTVLPGRALWPWLNTALDLVAVMAEIHDGAGRLSPWWSPLPSLVLDRLAPDPAPDPAPDQGNGDSAARGTEGPGAEWNATAARAAATLLHAAQARDARLPALPVPLRLARLPGSDVEPHAERQHLVTVARHLSHPLVAEAAALAGEARAAGVGSEGTTGLSPRVLP